MNKVWFQIPEIVAEHAWYTVSTVFTLGGVWGHLVYALRNMATKGDVRNAMLEVRNESLEKFRTKEDCNLEHSKKNGKLRQEGQP